MQNITIDYDSLPWWAQPLLVCILLTGQDPEELKRYAELAEKELQEPKDKKPLG